MAMTRTWWGERFLSALEGCMDSGRLTRGRSYSSPTRLLRFDIKGREVRAHLKGNVNPYFNVYKTPYYDATIQLKAIPRKRWQAIIGAISENAAWLSQLLMNEMPNTIEQAFSSQAVSLLPESGADLVAQCSCPDYANPCKHIAGAYYKVASLIDRDPFLLFQLRGMNRSDLQQALGRSPLGKALLDHWGEPQERPLELLDHRYPQPVLESIAEPEWRHFWQAGHHLPSREPREEQATPAILIKKGGDYPAFWNQDRSFVAVMAALYSRVLAKNKSVL